MSYKSKRTKYLVFIIIILICNSTIGSQSFFNKVVFTNYYTATAINLTSQDYFEGYNLFVLETCDLKEWTFNKSVIIADLEGNIYFQKLIGVGMGGIHIPPVFIDSTTIMYSDQNGANLWNFETDEVINLNIFSHHDLEKNYANNTIFSLTHHTVPDYEQSYLYDRVIESNAEGNTIWYYETERLVSPDQWCPYQETSGAKWDLTHTNTVIYDEEEDTIYLNMRHVNSFYKIDHKTKKLIWSLGQYSNFTQYDINGNIRDVLFYHSHALEKVDDNTYLLFDNDQHNITNALDQSSKLMEITVDENKMQANVTWQWIAPKEYFSFIWGDSDLLPNGNFFGTFGTHNHPNTKLGARLVELNRNGEIVWKMDFPETPNSTYGIYQTDRFRFAPIVSQPRLVEEESSQYVEWDVWYNFRAKTEFIGNYYISINEEQVETDQITFPRNWQSTSVRYYLNETEAEIDEISLVVEDEAGHLSNDTDKYSSIGKLFVEENRTALILGLSIGGTIALSLISFVIVRIIKKKPKIRKKK